MHAVLILLSSPERPGEHLRYLAALAGAAELSTFLPAWIDASTERALQQLLLSPDASELAA